MSPDFLQYVSVTCGKGTMDRLPTTNYWVGVLDFDSNMNLGGVCSFFV